jgi:DNA-binding NarL/FixJ family response regulator
MYEKYEIFLGPGELWRMRIKTGSVVLADADRRARETTAASLRRAGYETIEVETGRGALGAAREDGVRLVLLEVDFPDMSGYEVCHELRETTPDGLAIFFLSGIRTEPLDRVAGLLLGADDFIVKPFDPNELIARIRRFISRRPEPSAAHRGNGRPTLTEREQEVLALLVEGGRQKEIAQRLSISPKTVGTHIQNLLGKMGVHSRAELVARAYMLGLFAHGGEAAAREESTILLVGGHE